MASLIKIGYPFSDAAIYCKPEFYGPTHSYKDRIAPVIIAEAVSEGFKKIAVVSSGNFGLALAYSAKTAGLDCSVLCLSSIVPHYKDSIKALGAHLEFYNDTESAYKGLKAHGLEGYFLASVPFEERKQKDAPGIEGYEMISKEIIEELGDAPDFIIIPAAYGDGAMGMLRGFIQTKKQKLSTKIPRFVLARNHVTKNDVVYSISTNRTTPQVEHVLKMSNGVSAYFKEAEYRRGQKILKEDYGFDAEISSGGIMYALKKLSDEKMLSKKMKVVAILTAGNAGSAH